MPWSMAAAKQCRFCAEAIELIHAGSLVVDDIEDGSPVRRGRPALHVRYGIPTALNAGNWLYFWPFQLLKETGLAEEDLLHVYERYHRTLLRAHFGQALDLGAKVDSLAQSAVVQVCLASMRLKTGALMGFATLLGGAIANAAEKTLSVLDDFGRDLGVALQMFDDLGNVIGKCEPSKRFEDLILSKQEICKLGWRSTRWCKRRARVRAPISSRASTSSQSV
jgi:geranylgeranyl pyrophosphate synthase